MKTNDDQSNTSTQCWNCKTIFNGITFTCPKCGANGLPVSYQPNPYAKNDGDYPEEVRIQRERDRLAADSNAKAGSEEETSRKITYGSPEWYISDIIRRCHGAKDCPHEGNCVTKEQTVKMLIALIAQSSAQAETRGRVSELESLSSFLQADIQRSLKENGLSVYPENTYPYKEEIEKRLDQLRAQGGENK